MSTKEQERKALEKIRKIVADLGENSYIGMAFEGCFEVAEQNIENDWGCSIKQRAESAEKDLEKAEKKIAQMEACINNLKMNLDGCNDEYSRMKGLLELEIKDLKRRMLAPDDLVDFGQMLDEEIAKRDEIIRHEAETIVELADTPNDIAFQNAVRIHRNAKTDRKYYEDMAARVRRARELCNACNPKGDRDHCW